MTTLKGLIEGYSQCSWSDALAHAASWPPDLFAFCAVILDESGAYRHAVSPSSQHSWPPATCEPHQWAIEVRDFAQNTWIATGPTQWTTGSTVKVPSLGFYLDLVSPNIQLSQLDQYPEVYLSLLQFLAIADEACVGLGLQQPVDSFREDLREEYEAYRLEGVRLLEKHGSLSSWPSDLVRILPKTRTPQAGMTLRSLSHHVAMTRSEVEVDWCFTSLKPRGDSLTRFRMLLYPWPFSISAKDFEPRESQLENLDDTRFGFFAYEPAAEFDNCELENLVTRASRLVGEVDAVVLPELALTDKQATRFWRDFNGSMFLSGVRTDNSNEAWLFTAGLDEPLRQSKHHRWALESSQINTYGLGHQLNPNKIWWEDTLVQRRRMTFAAFNGWLTTCHLVCEDLARVDPVAEVVRAVGPTLVLALLLDGPQLSMRWPGRYASVFSDDPGSSVLSLTSYGMAMRSSPDPSQPGLPIIALWSDPVTGRREIRLEDGCEAVVLTLWAEMTREYTADGRHDGGAAARILLGAIEQIPRLER